MHDSVLCLKIHQLLDDISFKSRTNGRFVAPLTIEKTTADDLDRKSRFRIRKQGIRFRFGFRIGFRIRIRFWSCLINIICADSSNTSCALIDYFGRSNIFNLTDLQTRSLYHSKSLELPSICHQTIFFCLQSFSCCTQISFLNPILYLPIQLALFQTVPPRVLLVLHLLEITVKDALLIEM